MPSRSGIPGPGANTVGFRMVLAPEKRRWREVSPVLRATICLLAFLAFPCLLVGFRGSRPPAYFTFHQDRLVSRMESGPLDYIAYGSSYVACHFSPAVIEAHSGLQGFNFGIGGMHGHDLETAIRKSLRPLPRKPRMVLIDLAEWPTASERKSTSKPFASHSLTGSLRMASWSFRSGDVNGAYRQIVLMLNEALRVGQPPWRPVLVNVEARESFLREGYVPLEAKQRTGLEEELLLRTMTTNRQRHRQNLRVDPEGLLRLARKLEAEGITPVFVRSPISVRFRDEAVSDYDGLPHVLWFDDPVAFPEFFDPALRNDATHLNGAGARLFSARVGQRLAGLAAGPTP